MRKFITILIAVMAIAAQGKNLEKFVARGYLQQADTTAWVPVQEVHVSLHAINDTTAVPFKLLTGNDSTKTTGTDSRGEIRLMVNAGMGEYVLTFDREGFEPLVHTIKVTSVSQDVVYFGTLKMRREHRRRLREVEVQATAIKMVMNGDTIVYNADAFNLAEGSMLDALVERLPGAELRADGQIYVNGRFINSLLVNGQDFFKGDPQVALQNLPAYTVKSIKVYDRAGKDDYLTHASQKLNKREDEENLVMDVVLKKEYSLGYLANLTGGFGTDNRYIGQAFAMVYGDKFRLSLFGNTNNINDNSKVNRWNPRQLSGGSWGGGITTTHTGGLNYNYDDKKRVEISGDAMYQFTDNDQESQTSIASYLPGRNLYGCSLSQTNLRRHNVTTRHDIDLKFDNVRLTVTPYFKWSRDHQRTLTRSKTYENNDNIDNNENLLTADNQASRELSNQVSGNLQANLQIRPRNMRTIFYVRGDGTLGKSWSAERTAMQQQYGEANTSVTPPLASDRYRATDASNADGEAMVGATHTWRTMDEVWSRQWRLGGAMGYKYERTRDGVELYLAPDGTVPDYLVPTLSRPATFLLDPINTHRSINTSDRANAMVQLRYEIERVTPSDSCSNPSFDISLNLEEKFYHRVLDYSAEQPQRVMRRDNWLEPSLEVYYGNDNKRRSYSLNLSYKINRTLIPLGLFVATPNTSNPLLIYTNNASGLHMPLEHEVNLYWNYFSREGKGNTYLNFQFSKTIDAIGESSTIDPETGVTVISPCNVQGNWQFFVFGSHSHNFLKDKNLTLRISPQYDLTHHADYVALSGGSTERATTNDHNIMIPIALSYAIGQSANVGVDLRPGFVIARSKREDFTPVNAMQFGIKPWGNVNLPQNWRIETGLNALFRSGFQTEEMNRTEFIWNASVSKSFKRPKLTLKLAAYDILNTTRHYNCYVSAYSRIEQRDLTLRRYIMLTATLSLSHNPKK